MDEAKAELEKISIGDLNQRAYLYHGTYAEFYNLSGNTELALQELDNAIGKCTNSLEIDYLQKKKDSMHQWFIVSQTQKMYNK